MRVHLPKFEKKPMTEKEEMIYRLTIGLLLGIIGIVAIKLFMPQSTLDYMMWMEYEYLLQNIVMPKWQAVLYSFFGALLLPFVLPWTIYRKRDGQHIRAAATLRRGMKRSDSVAEITTLFGKKIYVADYKVFRIASMIIIFGSYSEYKNGKDIILEDHGEIHENTLLKRQLGLLEAEIAEKDRIINSFRTMMDDIRMPKEPASRREPAYVSREE